MAMAAVRLANGHERLETIQASFADANEEACRVRNTESPGHLQHLEPPLRGLVRRAVVRRSWQEELWGKALEHGALRNRHLAQQHHLLLRADAGIHVWQQGGLLYDELAARSKVLNRRPVAHGRKLLASIWPSRFRSVSQREKCLGAAVALALARNLHDLLLAQVR